jgi:urea transport system permease protein
VLHRKGLCGGLSFVSSFVWMCWAALLLCVSAGSAQALTAEQARGMAAGDSDARIAAIRTAVASGDAALAPFLQALLDDEVKLVGERVFVIAGGQVREVRDASGAALPALPEGAEDVINNNRLRREISAALAALALLGPDAAQRRQAIAALKDSADDSQLPLVDQALARETDAELKTQLTVLRAGLLLASPEPEKRRAAAQQLASSASPATRAVLQERLQAEADPQVSAALKTALASVNARLAWGERLGLMFTGLSLGSILLLAALGLAISYGLMGVINMAHGELIMIGAYAAYVVQNLFRQHAPGSFDAYVLVAIPVSFFAAAAVGALMERTVIRWLYGRPLETLLATWGLSLILIQATRSLFGAQNVPVENPAWLSGGWQVLPNLILPYNRLAIIVFAFAVLAAVALLIARTRLGLFVRGVTQNRPMAACMGVNTARVDTAAFALGAGVAGLAGCALAQVGNVGPDLGQSYIVDSFMVVVLGGVGQLAGTVIAALGLGLVNKVIEGWAGAVLAKICVLVFIVLFIQKRPQGLFALKGRSADA